MPMPEDCAMLQPGEHISDAKAAEIFLSIHGDENIVNCNMTLWILNKNKNKWIKDRREIWRDIVARLCDRLLLFETRVDKDGNTVITSKRKDYSTQRRTYNMLSLLCSICRRDDLWELTNQK